MTSMGNAMKSCFDLLNVNRMQSGIDTYGQVLKNIFLEIVFSLGLICRSIHDIPLIGF